MFTVETIIKLQRHAESLCDFEIIFGNNASLLEELQIKTFSSLSNKNSFGS